MAQAVSSLPVLPAGARWAGSDVCAITSRGAASNRTERERLSVFIISLVCPLGGRCDTARFVTSIAQRSFTITNVALYGIAGTRPSE